jgi:hypothetical protein
MSTATETKDATFAAASQNPAWSIEANALEVDDLGQFMAKTQGATTTTRKDAYGYTIETVARTPELLTDSEAAKSIGISTRKFNYVRRALRIEGQIVTGTELNKYPTVVYTPEQVAQIATEAQVRDGNGRLPN